MAARCDAQATAASSSPSASDRPIFTPSNPLLDTQQARPIGLPPVLPQRLPDYRPLMDPEQLRQTRGSRTPLPLFGYDFFEPARQVIAARRAALQRLFSTGLPSTGTRRPLPKSRLLHVPTTRELEAVDALTDAQKADLLERQRQGLLTPDERQQFRVFLFPSTLDPRRPASPDEVSAILALTAAQQVDLLTRQRQGTLTPDEKQRYRLFLYPEPETLPDDASTATTQEQQTAAENLTPAQKADLLTRQREGTLTDAEKQRYRLFLNPDQTSTAEPGAAQQGTVAGSRPNSSETGRAGQENENGFGGTEQPAAGDAGGQSDLSAPYDPSAAGSDQTGSDSTMPGTPSDNPSGGPDAGSTVTGLGPGAGLNRTRRTTPGTADQNFQDYQDVTGGAYGPGGSGIGDTGSRPFGQPPVDVTNNQIADPLATTLGQVIASAPTTYQISGGDTITLRYYSPTMEARELTLRVDPQGAVTIPEVGRIILRGQTTAQAETTLRQRMRRSFRNVEVSVQLREARTMPITVSGQSFFPGTYQVPAIASALNILYATGGPTADGTLRRIQVRRRGLIVGTIDFYKNLQGSQSADIALQPGDLLYIPERGKRVAVRGEVGHQAIYELAGGETLQNVLRFAGGIKPTGVSQRVLVSTVAPGASRLLKTVNASTVRGAQAVTLYDGDTVEVFSVRPTLTNKVSVEGAVDQPGDYAITPGMRVADLVETARGLLTEAYPARADLYRFNPNTTLTLIPIDLDRALRGDAAANIPLRRWDKLRIYTRAEVTFIGRRPVTVRGAVKLPGIYYRSDNMRVKDLLLQAGGTLPDAYTTRATLLHQRPDGSYAYNFVNLEGALTENPADNVLLQDRDVLAIYTNEEARFTPVHTISIQGEVVAPGNNYPRGEGMRLSDALHIAGGLTPRAGGRIQIAHARRDQGDPPTNVVYTATTGQMSPDPLLEDGDVITIQGRGSFQEHPLVVFLAGAVNSPGPQILRGPQVRLSEVIRQAGGLKTGAYPEGVEFSRDPSMLATEQQKRIAAIISRVNDLLNSSEYQRALAQSDIERIQAVGAATRSQSQVPIPGLSQPADTGSFNPAAGPGAASLFSHNLVSPPRILTAEDLQPKGNIAVNLAAALKRPGSESDIIMKDGDTVTVPERPTTVQVIGAVIEARGVLFLSGKGLGYYIDQAGGYAPDAARDRVLVIRVGGGLTPISRVRVFQPGDVILVPTKVQAAKIAGHSSDLDTIFRSLTNTALVVLVAKRLLGL